MMKSPSKTQIVKLMIFTITLYLYLTLCPSCSACGSESHAQSSWAKTVGHGSTMQKTTLEFYYHDVISWESPTTVLIARANGSTDDAPLAFGKLYMFDDPLTVGPDPKSNLVGRAQGMYGSDSLGEMGLIMAMGFAFTEDIYNGSSSSILVHNPIMVKHKELPIVGGTGLFRMAQGYAIPNTHMLDLPTGDAIVGYNVTILHHKKDYFV